MESLELGVYGSLSTQESFEEAMGKPSREPTSAHTLHRTHKNEMHTDTRAREKRRETSFIALKRESKAHTLP